MAQATTSILHWLSAGVLACGLMVPVACVTEGAIKDICEDTPECESDIECPFEPPNQGVECDLPEGAECFYCSTRGRIDASHYECDDNGKWKRQPNLDCE